MKTREVIDEMFWSLRGEYRECEAIQAAIKKENPDSWFKNEEWEKQMLRMKKINTACEVMNWCTSSTKMLSI